MLTNKRPAETQFDAEIARILKELSHAKPDSEEYAALLERLSKLHKMQSETLDNTGAKMRPLSWDTILISVTNIAGIVLLTRYEKEHVITSKALNFVQRHR